MNDRNDEDWAVFWCSLLSPLRTGEIPADQRGRYFRELSEQERLLPNGRRRRISVRTLRRQWRRLRLEGVSGLYRRRRNDRGRPRAAQAALLARAVELKKEQPYRSDQVINRILKHEFGRQVPRSTLYRHLRREGATRRKLGISKEKVRCRWTRDQSNALWVGDFEHGPVVMYQGRAVKTHLSAWIDCHSRYILGARYYVRENLDILVDSLLRAWGQHGASRVLERAARSEGTLLLVFDEAHLLDAAALTDLRLLISSALDIGPPLKILLAGQDTLRATLRRTGHADLLNRVSVRYQLRPLSKDQTTRYLDFQMTQAGGSPKTFDESVKDLIHDFTGGVPRQINNLATACLLQATARKLARVDDAVFQQAAHEFQLP